MGESWAQCTTSCLEEAGDPGLRERKRRTSEADPSTPKCVAQDKVEHQLCAGKSVKGNYTPCPIDAKMSQWTTWGPHESVCGQSCKNGANATTTPIMQSRSRYCI